MADDADFVEADGFVHLRLLEHTLCGDAFDLAAVSDGPNSDEDKYEWTETKRRMVDCPRCTEIIRLCRGVRIAATRPEADR